MKFANFAYFCILCAEKSNQISKCGYTFPRIIQQYTKFARAIFSTFYNILQPNFTISLNLKCSFSAVLISIPNSKVCLKGNGPLVYKQDTKVQKTDQRGVHLHTTMYAKLSYVSRKFMKDERNLS